MGCILALIALLTPRIAIVLIWLLTDWLAAAFEGAIWPILGFVFMPYTVLAWTGGQLHGGVEGGWALLVLLAVIVDLGHAFGGGRQYRVHRGRRAAL
jgi:hypothetical protein